MTGKFFSFFLSTVILLAACQTEPVTPEATIQLGDKSLRPTPTAFESPACFTVREPRPFVISHWNDRLYLRTASGVQVVDLGSLQEVDFIAAPQDIYAAALSPLGDLAWSLENNSLQILRVADHQVIAEMHGHADRVYKLRFTSTGEQLVSASHDGFLRIWNLDGSQVFGFMPPGGAAGFDISPDSTLLATVPFDGPVMLWKFGSDQLLAKLGGTGGYDTSDAIFSAAGDILAADLATGVYLWDISNRELTWNSVKNSMALAFSPRQQMLAYSDIDQDNQVYLTSTVSFQPEAIIDSSAGIVYELFFSPDGSLLVAADGLAVRIWSSITQELLYIGKITCP